MKHSFIFLLLSIYLVGCMPNKPEYKQWVKQAEAAWPAAPEEARAWLDSVEYPVLLSDEWLTRYCVLACQLADSIGSPLPYMDDLERALYYVEQHGDLTEQARMGFYWGRALQEEGLHRPALNAFLEAEAQSHEAEDWHLAARVCKEIGILYEEQDDYDSARNWMEKSVKLYQQTNDKRNLGLTWRLWGKEYAALGKLDLALKCMYQADSIISQLGDSTDMSIIYNGIGNVYHMMGNLPKAKAYLYKSIAFDPNNSAPTCSALGRLYLKEDSLEKAEYFLNEAKQPSSNPYTHMELLYHYATLEEKKGNLKAALDTMRKYVDIWDNNIMELRKVDLAEAEAIFNRTRMVTENARLQHQADRRAIIALSSIVLLLTFVVCYQYQIGKQKAKNKQQEQQIEKLEKSVSEKNEELQFQSNQIKSQQKDFLAYLAKVVEKYKSKENEITNLQQRLSERTLQARKEMSNLREEFIKQITLLLQKTSIYQKMQEYLYKATHKKADKKEVHSLSSDDWQEVYTFMDIIYPRLHFRFLQAKLSEKEQQYCYLALFGFSPKDVSVLMHVNSDTPARAYTRICTKLEIKATDKRIAQRLAEIGLSD